MDETLMTYLRNIISLEQARYVQGQLLKQLHAAAVPPRKAPICMPQKPKQKWDVADGSIADGAKLGAMLGCVIGFIVLYAALEWIAIAAYNTEQAANEAGVCKWMMFLK